MVKRHVRIQKSNAELEAFYLTKVSQRNNRTQHSTYQIGDSKLFFCLLEFHTLPSFFLRLDTSIAFFTKTNTYFTHIPRFFLYYRVLEDQKNERSSGGHERSETSAFNLRKIIREVTFFYVSDSQLLNLYTLFHPPPNPSIKLSLY